MIVKQIVKMTILEKSHSSSKLWWHIDMSSELCLIAKESKQGVRVLLYISYNQ